MFCLVEICRFCLISDKELIDFKTYDDNNVSYFTKISKIMPVFTFHDISTKICVKCRQKIDEYYNFLQSSLKSQETLLQYASQLESASTCRNMQIFREKLQRFRTKITSYKYLTECAEISQFEIEEKVLTEDNSPSEEELPDFDTWDLKCKKCINTFVEVVDLKQHYIRYHLILPHNKCKLCNRGYSSLSATVKHIKDRHFDLNKYSCEVCDKHFTKLSKYEEHMKVGKHDTTCEICNEDFSSYQEMMDHYKSLHINSDYKCNDTRKILNIGDEQTTSKNSQDDSDTQVISERNVDIDKELPNFQTWGTTCKICNKTITLNRNMRKHYLTLHLKAKPYNCKICNKSYSTIDYLRYHNNVAHLKNYKFSCHLCNKKFMLPSGLKNHLQSSVHHTIECFSCDIYFANTKLLAKHLAQFHSSVNVDATKNTNNILRSLLIKDTSQEMETETIQSNQKQCETCKQEFTSEELFQDHKKTHFMVKSEEIIIPDIVMNNEASSSMETTTSVMIKQEIEDESSSNTETTETEMTSDLQSVFSQTESTSIGKPLPLLDNVEINSFKSWNQTCKVCNRKLATLQSLRRHYISTHLKIKLFKCDWCNREYIDESKLKMHVTELHLKSDKYSCYICSEKFADKYLLVLHLQNSEHYSKNCKFCNMVFDNAENFHNHMIFSHMDLIISQPDKNK